MRRPSTCRGSARGWAAAAFNLMGAAWGAKWLFGLKAYYVGCNGARFHVLLYSANDAKLRR